MSAMTPQEIVHELDKHIVGQNKAKKSVAIALLGHTELGAAEIVRKSLEIAGELCIYTNMHHTIETLT